MIVNVTTLVTFEATIHVFDLDTFVEAQLLKESPAGPSQGNFARKTITRMNGVQVISSRMGDIGIAKPTTAFVWLSQACKESNVRPELRVTGSRHDLWASMSDKWTLTRMASTIHGRITREIVKFHRCLSGCRGNTTASNSSSRASSSETNFEQSKWKAYSERKTRIAKCADARKLRERHAEEILTIGRTEFNLLND